MLRVAQLFLCTLAVAGAALTPAAPALAKGPRPSAGDQQYVDPLTSTTGAGGAVSSSSSKHSSTSTTGTSTLSPSPPSAAVTTTTTATTAHAASSTKTAQAGSRTLPFTGLNVADCVVVALALLAGGLALRRLAIHLA